MLNSIFNIQAKANKARAGFLNLNGIKIPTPVFMPVGTVGSVKSLAQEDLEQIDYKLILANTYHLYLRPGQEVLDNFGGIRKMMRWPRAMLTDSGGFQAFSLSGLSKYSDKGVRFQSHIDGSYHLFTPEKVIDIQRSIGADIIMPLDDCAPYPSDENRVKESLKRTKNWLQISKAHWAKEPAHQNLFGIVQGGVFPEHRKQSALDLVELDLPGYAVGGLSVGETLQQYRETTAYTLQFLPTEKPRYMMGVGTIPEILSGVEAGVDMFDCVLPTRNARNASVFTSIGKVNLRNAKHKLSDEPIDLNCSCRVCLRYPVGYIWHLHKAKEILAYSLSTYHNLYFMKNFMDQLREAILIDQFELFAKHWREIY